MSREHEGGPPGQASADLLTNAALLALVATQLASTWHAGGIGADEAMERLLGAVSAAGTAVTRPDIPTETGGSAPERDREHRHGLHLVAPSGPLPFGSPTPHRVASRRPSRMPDRPDPE